MRALAAVVLLVAPAPLPTYAGATLLGTVPLPEVSGLAPASTGTTLFVEQDSGNGARVQRLARDGRLLATYALPVRLRDAEDLARAADARGRSTLFLADTGDNDSERAEVQVHAFPEPAPDARAAGPVTTYRLRYADGPHDAEALLVLPGAREVALVTKTLGRAGVYVAPLDAGGVQVLRRVATLDLALTGTAGGPAGAFGQLLVTGGAVSPDGTRVALRTYTDLYEWQLDGDLGAVLARPGTRSPLPATEQGEAVAYERDGTGVLVVSEGRGAPLQRLTRGTAPRPTADPRPDTTGPTAGHPPRSDPDRSAPGWTVRPVLLAVLVAGLLVLLALARRVGRRSGG